MKKKKKIKVANATAPSGTGITVLKVVSIRVSANPGDAIFSPELKDFLDIAGFCDVRPDPARQQFLTAQPPRNGTIFLLEQGTPDDPKKFQMVSIDRDTRKKVESGRIMYLFPIVGQTWTTEITVIGDQFKDWTIFCSPATQQEIDENTFLKEHPGGRRMPVPPLEIPPETLAYTRPPSGPKPIQATAQITPQAKNSLPQSARALAEELAPTMARFIKSSNGMPKEKTPQLPKPPFVPVHIDEVATFVENPRVFIAQQTCKECGLVFAEMRNPLNYNKDHQRARSIIAVVLKDELNVETKEIEKILGVRSPDQARSCYEKGKRLVFFAEDKKALAIIAQLKQLIQKHDR